MKKNILMAVFCLILSAMSFAQVPQMMSYQAVVRGSDNNLVVNQQISMRVSILQGSADGGAVYTEIHSATTNANGLVSIEIGNGTSNDNFSAINWANGPYFVKTETDVNGGENYEIVGVSQLLSMPYAMYAQSAGNMPNVSGFLSEETQNLADVVALGNSANAQIKNLVDPTENQDAATKKYIDELIAQLQAATDAINSVIPTAHTITFDANGGIGEMQPQIFMQGVMQSIDSNIFAKEDYWFAGWNTAADGTGISYSNTQIITISMDMTLYAQWIALTGQQNGHTWVNLGLPSGTLWATCNVGANNPEDYGNYYAWGETSPKNTYNWNTYIYCNGDYNTLTKYCNSTIYGFSNAVTTVEQLLASDDAASVNWGNGWQTPSCDEMQELVDNCSIAWASQNGVNGYVFTGPSGNSIFLPATGYYTNSTIAGAGSFSCGYWANSIYTNSPDRANGLGFYENGCHINRAYRSLGRPIRAVCRQ